MGDEPESSREKRVQFVRQKRAEIAPHEETRQNGRARLHQPFDEQRTVILLFQKRRAPEVFFHFLCTHEHDRPDAQGRQLGQETLENARTGRGQNEVDPGLRRGAVVRKRHGHARPARNLPVFDCRNRAGSERAVHFARFQRLADFAVQDREDVFGAGTVERGAPVRYFVRLEEDAVHLAASRRSASARATSGTASSKRRV